MEIFHRKSSLKANDKKKWNSLRFTSFLNTFVFIIAEDIQSLSSWGWASLEGKKNKNDLRVRSHGKSHPVSSPPGAFIYMERD